MWDIAAGIILVKEAGGIINDIDLSNHENIKVITSSANIDAKLKGYKIFTIDTPLYYLNTKNNISNNYYEEQMYYSKKASKYYVENK